MKKILFGLILLLALCANAQEVSLDKNVYWVPYEYSEASLRVSGSDFGTTLKVDLFNKETGERSEILKILLKTKREKYFRFNLLNFPTGNYRMEVHLDRDWSQNIDFMVIKKNN